MFVLRAILVFSSFFSVQTLWAQSSSTTCTTEFQKIGAYAYHRYQGQRHCFLSAASLGGSYNYRAPLLTDEGTFMIFNSYENQNVSDGARVFYFFPRTRIPSFELINNQVVLHTAADGIDILLHPVKQIFVGMNGGVLSEDYDVNPFNKGGIEISKVQTLWMDAGFQAGNDPTASPTNTSRFTDRRGKTCSVKNSEIFLFDNQGDSWFRFDDAQLKKFLQRRCSGLEVNW